jgi:hypothetical protein
MPRLFLDNFDFEYELAGVTAPTTVRGLHPLLSWGWRAVAAPGDVVAAAAPAGAPDPVPEVPDRAGGIAPARMTLAGWAEWRRSAGSAETWELVPWGWSRQAVQCAAHLGFRTPHPPIDVVRQINHRAFRLELEQRLGTALPGTGIVDSMEDAAARARHAGGPWVIKAGYGMSARERWRGRPGELPAQAGNWLRRVLRRDGLAVWEPWVERVAECSFQFDVSGRGPPEFLGQVPLLVDSRGAYAGSLILPVPRPLGREWDDALEACRAAAAAVQELGYFGPLGIDAMCHRTPSGATAVRPLQDLNARWTFGRLALGWRRDSGSVAWGREALRSVLREEQAAYWLPALDRAALAWLPTSPWVSTAARTRDRFVLARRPG